MKPVLVEEVDPHLEAEDVLQMVNANIFQYTLVDDHIAMLWSQVLGNIEIQPDISINQGGEIAWAVRKNNPVLLDRLNKFVAGHKQAWELYDLEADRTELNNLAKQHPQRVKELAAKWDAWADRCGVKPWPVKRAKKK